MRPKAIKGAGAVDYYAQLVPGQDRQEGWERAQAEGRGAVEDYYLPLGETPGRWWGAGAVQLGLEGDGHRDQMGRLLDGLDPVSGVALGQRPRPDGVRAYDLTFSAPKSVSVLAGLVGGETEREVIGAHDAAVAAALGVLEERATTRGGKNGVNRLDAGGLTALLVRHRTSRERDPQLHTHALVFAKVQGPDGRWRALDAGIVFRAQRMFGAAYQSALRSEMTVRLGVEWGPVEKGQADLVGFDEELLQAFSTRSEQVARAAGEGLSVWRDAHPGREPSERERAIIVRDGARASRPGKDHSRPGEELRVDHLAVAAGHGWDGARVSDQVLGRVTVGRGGEEVSRGEEARIAEEVLGVLAERRSVWSAEHVEREVYVRLSHRDRRDAGAQMREGQRIAGEITGGSCLDLAELAGETAGRRLDQAPGVRSVLEDGGVQRYSTRELLEQEQRIIRWFTRAAAEGGTPASPDGLARASCAGVLDAEQALAACLAAGTGRAVVIVGPAGTGKTTTLKPVVEALHADGRDVLGLAPTAVAAETLHLDTGVAAENVSMFLTLHAGGDPPPHVALRPGGSLLIDEAGMLGTGDLERVLRIAGQRDLRVVMVGDGRQLFAVGRGGMFDQAREVLPCVEFGQVYRFHEHWERPASLGLRAGRPEALTAYAEHGRIRAGNAQEIYAAMLTDYLTARQAGQSTAFSVPTNDQAQHLNQLVREQLIAAGEVNADREATVRGGQRVGVGDEIATRQNDWGLRSEHGGHVKNRHRWRVQAVGADGSLTVSDPDRGHVTLPAGYVRDSTELAYFRSTHGVQSLTQDIGGTLVDVNSGHRDVYVGMTRGRMRNTAYVVCEADQTTEQVLHAALRRDRADLGVLAVSQRLTEDLRVERQRQDAEHATAVRAPAVAVPDRLASYRRALGDQHAAWLADRARALAATAASMDQALLVSERAKLAPDAQSLDPKAAMQAGRALRDRDLAVRRAEEALAAAQALRAEAAQARGLRDRPHRQQLEQAADVQDAIARREQAGADGHTATLDRLAERGGHPGRWMKDNGEQAARWLAVQGELDARRARTIALTADRALANPPAHIRETIGDPPELVGPERGEWERLCRDLERERLERERDVDEGLSPKPDRTAQRDRQRRIDALRQQRGLPALEQGRHAESTGIERA